MYNIFGLIYEQTSNKIPQEVRKAQAAFAVVLRESLSDKTLTSTDIADNITRNLEEALGRRIEAGFEKTSGKLEGTLADGGPCRTPPRSWTKQHTRFRFYSSTGHRKKCK